MLISDAAKEVHVENHVLRYWEEELRLPIKRNEMGHRYYTASDVERFKKIKNMKEQGLQLKAIKTVLQAELSEGEEQKEVHCEPELAISIVDSRDLKEEKTKKLQWLLQQLFMDTLEKNNIQLCNEIKETILKELDYQFRMQEEREEARDRKQEVRTEEYYKKMDELLRVKTKKKRHFIF
jgi:DNA-binding transcriptional MerR regulator